MSAESEECTTRRHPRTLAQAFPRDYANPIERVTPEQSVSRILICVLAAIAGAVLGMRVFGRFFFGD